MSERMTVVGGNESVLVGMAKSALRGDWLTERKKIVSCRVCEKSVRKTPRYMWLTKSHRGRYERRSHVFSHHASAQLVRGLPEPFGLAPRATWGAFRS
jgi:hypothetical protein